MSPRVRRMLRPVDFESRKKAYEKSIIGNVDENISPTLSSGLLFLVSEEIKVR